MDMRDIDKLTHKNFVDAMLRDLTKAFPRRLYTSNKTHAEIMFKEGEQKVIEYLREHLT